MLSKRTLARVIGVFLVLLLAWGALETATFRTTRGQPATVTPPLMPSVASLIGTVNRPANLRAGPGTDYAVVGGAQAGQTVQIIGTNAEQSWYQLVDQSWIAAFLVTVPSPIPPLPIQPTPAPISPAPSAAPSGVELMSPLLVDSEAGRLYMAGRVGEKAQTVVLTATDGRLQATYDISGALGLDRVHGWLYVDQPDQGLAVLDAQSGMRHTLIPLPRSQSADQRSLVPVAPQADPATGQVLAFRDHVVYLANPETGEIARTIPFTIPQAGGCNTLTGPLPIEWATYDSTKRLLYLAFTTYVCTPWIGYTLVSYDLSADREIVRQEVLPFQATAFAGSLYGSSWERMGDSYRWAWRAGRPSVQSSDWGYALGFQVDPTRQRLYAPYAGGLSVFDARTMALLMVSPLPLEGELVGYDPKSDQLYFLDAGQLRLWPGHAIQPPAPQPLVAALPPTTAVRWLIVSPTWAQDQTLFGIWSVENGLGSCWVFGQSGGPLYVSSDRGTTWSQSSGGLGPSCDLLSTLAVSPDYAHDQTLLAGVMGLGLFKSTDGGQLWQPASSGLPSMNIEEILLSPGFAHDQTAFVKLAPAGGERVLYRSQDGGRRWQALDLNGEHAANMEAAGQIMVDHVALSPEFDQDHTLMGVTHDPSTERYLLHISRDGGEHWAQVGTTPAGGAIDLLRLAPLFAKWHVLFAFGDNGTLYRSADEGVNWASVLSTTADTGAVQLVFAPDIEVNRPLFLLTKPQDPTGTLPATTGTLYRSGDGGMAWRAMQLPNDSSPTALAISPNFVQDRLLIVGTAEGRILIVEESALSEVVPLIQR